ncbi:bifunctional ADP-dependent NAD(P)H-hydrate dehydratase/NAD(P)H-hydrate epimerase [Kaistella antarctica]|uniref:Bifunctional NAD(P)H-hydrate repair enzyme n=1 Tax=Kaistella antarctica TaxID=266748 RepID=A0A448NV69_9FLAO|nr:bifunctional ADP-dependent NAD(P)H-hydrate dehydratase/NAD(P)H-hydrate epimerase [Kaistella antarctica]KEY20224.1 sugar kinase [Kaistella antarctica]SEV92146.1 NAD(P)H-hydrate epimerase [Kaistella antarctica]VEI01712.1 Nicotinamide nucleotide repair protein [Kaistella antarctica]
MKIFTSDQIKKWDEFTMRSNGISSLELMERAAHSCAKWFVQNYFEINSFAIFCGAGNNGGDGFAIARLLYKKGFEVILFADESQVYSESAAINQKKCKDISGLEILKFENANNFIFKENTIIVDALFGIGLNRPIQGKFAHLIQFLNDLNHLKISIDIPSGLMADEMIADQAVVFKANDTLTFQSWKKSMLHPETGIYCGNIHVRDISLSEEFNSLEPSNELVIDEKIIGEIYQPRNEFSHKGTYGKATVVAGSYGKIGAVVLATKAALKSGSGLTFILAPKCGYEILQISCPEAMFISGGENEVVNFSIEENSTLGIGPGLGTHSDTEKSFLNFLKTCKNPLVIDADALNILSKNPDYLKLIPKSSIITPHPKEFARLFGPTENSFARLDLAREKAHELQIYIVLKDHHTQVITPDNRVFYNITGNSGMAKGGSGDALLGIITSLLAQSYSPENAAIFGAWLHGKAGDFAAEEFSKEAMLPSDLIDQIGNVFKYLNKKVLPKNRKD